MRNALKREWARWREERAKRHRQSNAIEADQSAWPWLDRLRWWLLPLLLSGVLLASWYQLHQLTQPTQATVLPIVIDAPLSSPYRLGWAPAQKGHYFRLRSKGLEGRFVAYAPGPGTRAYQGNDAVALFSQRQPHAELTPSPCGPTPAPDDVIFATGDGLLLWLCQSTQDEDRFALRRIGWRFSQSRWQRGLSLGKSANNEIVMGSALLPSYALRLTMRGRRLHVALAPQEASLPAQHRLLCLTRIDAPPTPPAIPKVTKQPLPTKQAPKPIPLPCHQKPLFLESGQLLRIHAKHHPTHAVTLRWQPSLQEKGSHDLLLTPANGNGLSQRRLSLASLQQQNASGFLIGNAELYFREIRPNAVRTQDLDEIVHELLLRQVLQYADPSTLRAALGSRYRNKRNLETLAKRTPMALWLPQLQALNHNRYLRNRLWLTNRSLAKHYRLQARNLFRIRFERGERNGALLGLGNGGATIRAPRQHILHGRRKTRSALQDIRLRTILTSRDQPTPYLQQIDAKEKPIPGRLLWLTTQPLEILRQPGQLSPQSNKDVPTEIAKRQFTDLFSALQARTVLWRGGRMYGSHHPFAYQSNKTNAPTNRSSRPTRFLYQMKKRWWQRKPGQQRSSEDWPLSDVAKHLGTLLTQNKLLAAMQQLNTSPAWRKPRKHCGNQSKREGGQWKHKRHCWGNTQLLKRTTRFLAPCSELVRSKIRERYCRPGVATPQIDKQGRPLLPVVKSLDGLHGAVLIPTMTQPNGQTSFQLRLLPGSLPVRLDGRVVSTDRNYPLRDGARLQMGDATWQLKQPTGELALARYRGEYIASHYPEGMTFAHVIAGSVGGPFRSRPKDLQRQLPPEPQTTTGKAKAAKTKSRRLATTLSSDLQRTAFAVASRHFARLDSPEFQKLFRRRYVKNPHKPHAGAVVILNRRTGEVLTSLSFPSFDPNLPPLQSQMRDDQRSYRYLRGQIVDRYGMTDSLLAYHPSRLPPNPPARKRLQGRPDKQPDYIQALRWDREEELRGIRGTARSGWLLERAFGGAQTPGSTAKLVTAAAYARYLRRKGRSVRFPKHTCSGGLMFMRERRLRNNAKQWRPSTLRFRCHKREGHGHIGLKQAMASSCNVYFAKLALEMAGADPKQLRRGEVRWVRNRHGGQGKYQMLRIPRNALSEAMKRDPNHRALFRTAAALGFSMRYTYRRKSKRKARRQYARYTDAYWEPPMTTWAQPPTQLNPKQRTEWRREQRQKRRQSLLPGGSFGNGRFFGNAAAYPAWQQWVHGAIDPRHQRPVSVQRTFGSTDASLRAMAYVGFGQNLIATPLRLALLTSTIANGGWLPLPHIWRGDWQGSQPPSQMVVPRTKPKRILHAADARLLQQALAAVTNYGTAGQPFAQLNRQCLKPLGLQVIGKTGTAENRSQRARAQLRDLVKRGGAQFKLPGNRRWFQQSGCYRRRFWRYYAPEENVADSLFVGAILPLQQGNSPSQAAMGNGWKLKDLAFAIVVKNGYHPEGAPCRRKGKDLDRSEARYLAHDILVAAIQKIGLCRAYKDISRNNEQLKGSKRRRIRRRKSRRRRKRTRRRSRARRRPKARRRTRTRRRSRRRRRAPKRRAKRRRR